LYEKFFFCVRQKIHLPVIPCFMFFGLNIYEDPFLCVQITQRISVFVLLQMRQ
jgi:hypothetical protein